MELDDVIKELGDFGNYQRIIYAFICIPILLSCANNLSYIFTAGVPNYRCSVVECDDPSAPRFETEWTKYAIPFEASSGDVKTLSKCFKYSINSSALSKNKTCDDQFFLKEIQTCNEWIFDEMTIVNEFNITCLPNQWKLSLVGTIHFAGIIVGSITFGYLADKFGRKRIFLVSVTIMSITGCALVFSPNFTIFMIINFISALGTSGVYPTLFTMCLELVGNSKRELAGMFFYYCCSFGEATISIVACLTNDWKRVQICISGPPILFTLYYFFLPESLRWLMAKKKPEKAFKIVRRAARFNKIQLSDEAIDFFRRKSQEIQVQGKRKHFAAVRELLQHKKLLIRYAFLYLIWIMNSFVYYGLSNDSTSLYGDKHLNFVLVSLAEIPGCTVAWFSIKRFGRRPPLIVSLIICSVTCGLTILVHSNIWGVICLFLVGKLGITAAFYILYIWTAELIPTVLRSGGIGLGATMSGLGAMLAPFVPLLKVAVYFLPMLTFSAIALLSMLIVFKLPETFNKRLPENFEEALEI